MLICLFDPQRDRGGATEIAAVADERNEGSGGRVSSTYREALRSRHCGENRAMSNKKAFVSKELFCTIIANCISNCFRCILNSGPLFLETGFCHFPFALFIRFKCQIWVQLFLNLGHLFSLVTSEIISGNLNKWKRIGLKLF